MFFCRFGCSSLSVGFSLRPQQVRHFARERICFFTSWRQLLGQ
jgi:hypothetical protein